MNYHTRKLRAIEALNHCRRRMLYEFFGSWAFGYFIGPLFVVAALLISENADAIDNWIMKTIEKLMLW